MKLDLIREVGFVNTTLAIIRISVATNTGLIHKFFGSVPGKFPILDEG
jgi:hypothetical protein